MLVLPLPRIPIVADADVAVSTPSVNGAPPGVLPMWSRGIAATFFWVCILVRGLQGGARPGAPPLVTVRYAGIASGSGLTSLATCEPFGPGCQVMARRQSGISASSTASSPIAAA